MSKYDAAYPYRAAITVDGSANTDNSKDVVVTIPPDMAEFWDTVLSTGADVRVCTADGRTLATKIHLSTWDYANKSGVIAIEAVDVTTNSVMHALWLVWGDPDAVTVSTAFTPSTALLAHLWIAEPVEGVVVVKPERPGDTAPRVALSKPTAEVTYLFWDFGPRLLTRATAYAGSKSYEEIATVDVAELQDANGDEVPGTHDLSRCRLLDGGVAQFVEAGATGTSYTAVCVVTTTLGRTLEARALVRVRNVTE